MYSSSNKRLVLAALIFAFTVASAHAQALIPADTLGQLIYTEAFSHVPQNEYNQVFQNFVKTTYPGRNSFYQSEISGVTSSFVLYLVSSKTSDAWAKYASSPSSAKFSATHRLTADLNVFSRQDGGSSVVASLKKGNSVQVLEYGEYASWNGITAKWAKVQTSDNKTGWLFSAYLEEAR